MSAYGDESDVTNAVEQAQVTRGGLTLQGWQAVIWALTACIIVAIIIALITLYRINRHREVGIVRPRINRKPKVNPIKEGYEAENPSSYYSQSEPEREIDGEMAIYRQPLATQLPSDNEITTSSSESSMSLINEFRQAGRYGRRDAIPGRYSMIVQPGSKEDGVSLRSGVTDISTPRGTPDASGVHAPPITNARTGTSVSANSLHVEIGERFDDGISVYSGVTGVVTPRGSCTELQV